MKPNLFNIATKELSQDAFITWLLQWASPDCREYDAQLYECAVKFARQLLALGPDAPEDITSIRTERQWINIDVCAEVNDKYLIIIEDKILTGEHSDQLKRYRQSATEWCLEHGYQVVCIYIKTGSDSSSTLKKVKEQGFAVFSRKAFLEILRGVKVTNNIFVDFRERLEALEHEENQYVTKRICEWGPSDWKGFYQGLEHLRPFLNWNLVNPPRDASFWNAVLNWFELEEYCPYMQIEQGPLCFKVGDVSEKRSEIRNHFHGILMNGFQGRSEVRRPDRFGTGAYMTVAIVGRENWLGGDDDIVNMEQVVLRLNEYEQLPIKVIKDAEQSAEGSGG